MTAVGGSIALNDKGLKMSSGYPLASIIVPMRNAESYVSEALFSILQEKDIAIEVIVVNDRSTDLSLKRVLEFRDDRIRVIEGSARGIAACMNTGLAEARGAIIMRCDADDVYPQARIRQQVRWLESHPEFDAVCGAFLTLDRRGTKVADLQCGPEPRDITGELFDGRVRTHLCTYAIRSSLIARVGGFREYFESAEDVDFQLRLSERGRIFYVPTIWYCYRVHETSVTHTQNSEVREFFEQMAFDLHKQRRLSGQDDLEKGLLLWKPADDGSTPNTARNHIAGLLLGRAWREHRAGNKTQALKTGLRALAASPLKINAEVAAAR